MTKSSNKELLLKNATVFFAYLLIVWGMYRLLIKLPDEIEELFVKPLLWLIPLFLFLKKEKRGLNSLGITTKNLFPSLYWAVGLGALFAIEALVINFVKYSGFSFEAELGSLPFKEALLLSFVTAAVEETVFRGYIFSRVWEATGAEWTANLATSLAWGLVHVPVSLFVLQLSLPALFTYILLITVFGIGSAFVFARTKNIFSSVLLHVLWQWPIVLFR